MFSMPYRRGEGSETIATTDPLSVQFKHYGIIAIERILAFNGVLPSDAVNGRYGWRTARAVRKFQKEEGLVADGIAGRSTCKALFSHLIDQSEQEVGLHPGLLQAILEHESWSDPGAWYVNESGSVDRGIAMLNSSAYPDLDYSEATDVFIAIPIAAHRLREAQTRYFDELGLGDKRALNCTIASYNSPVGANALARGEEITPKLRGYINDVKAILEGLGKLT